jgi:hypothetical protein
MDDVVVLAVSSPRSDPIRSYAASGGASESCTRTVQRRLLLPWSSKYGGEIDWISNTTAWCLWWRVSAAGLRLRAVAREREVEGSSWPAARVRVGVVGGCTPAPLYIGVWPASLAPSKP